MFDLLIKNGTIVLVDQTFDADLGIQNGVIVEMGKFGDRMARQVVNAANQYVFPGMIDPHLHLAHPFKDTHSTDDFFTGTCAAAAGGNTTIIDFAIQWSGNPEEALAARMKEAEGKAVIDYSFHPCLTNSNPDNLAFVPRLLEKGLPSFKVYMVYRRQGRKMDDGGLLAMLQHTAAQGGITGVHAENEDIADYNLKVLEQNGHLGPAFFPEYKPDLVEAEAIHRVLYLNHLAGSRLYIFHLSTKDGLAMIRQARAEGQKVRAETCVHYLTLNKDVYTRPDGAHFICSPPLREDKNVEALWDGLMSGDISIVSSDHCGFSTQQKTAFGETFLDVPNGLPGVETRLPVMYAEGVGKNRITVNKLVELLSTNPAKIFGLYPRKGTISLGCDADIIIFDPTVRRSLNAVDLKTPAAWTPYEGVELKGWPSHVISKGDLIYQNGVLDVLAGRGQFLARTLPDWL